MRLSSPCPLTDKFKTDGFHCGVPSLDGWLKRRARGNETPGASRTYVVCEKKRVIGYYALASGSIATIQTPGKIRRNMPPIPVIVLGRLAVDRQYQGKGVGKAMLRDAILRVLQAAEIAGVRALLVHAISEDARQFYEGSGFLPSPLDPMTLALPLDTIKKA